MLQNNFSALVADPSSTVRLSLRAILQSFDITRVDTASSVAETRRRLLDGRYDLVLCEYHFESEETGHDLLEELRGKQALSPMTIFIMVTSEASYARVIGVAEETPDDYMLKPVHAGDLSDRIEKCFRRRQSLFDIYESLGKRDYSGALKNAQRMMAEKTPYLSDIVRLAANTLYKLGRFDEAAAMYRRILETRNPAWAKLGIARVGMKQGDKQVAEAAMKDLIAQHLRYLPVYNQLSELYLSEERYADALDITEQAIKITPHSVKRLQQAGQLSYSLGDEAKAAELLGRAVRINGKAADLDYRSIFHLALLNFSANQLADASSLVKQMRAKYDADTMGTDGRRGEWYSDLSIAAEAIAKREPLAAIDIMRRISGAWDAPDFNFDLALDYLAVIARLYAEDIAGNLAEWIQPMALRFATGRHAQDLLCQPITKRDKLVGIVAEANEHISKVANDAAQLMVEDDVKAAADLLVAEGTKTRNNRLLAAAANAASKGFQKMQDEVYRQYAETCLAFMTPPDDNLTRRIRTILGTGTPM
jgi:tetratricopeptide (TPR) repeat protein